MNPKTSSSHSRKLNKNTSVDSILSRFLNVISSRMNKARMDTKGFSLVEMAVAMGIMALIMPAVVSIMVTTVQARDVAMTTTSNTLSYNAFNVTIRNDIQNASAVNVPDSNTIQISDREGVCSTWALNDTTLQKVNHDLPLSSDSSWLTVSDQVKAGDSGEAFSLTGNTLTYDLVLGKDNNEATVQGEVTPQVAATSHSECW